MIIHLKSNLSDAQIRNLAQANASIYFKNKAGIPVLVSSSSTKELSQEIAPFVDEYFEFSDDCQLGSKNYQADKRSISIGELTIGGQSRDSLLITGPCSVENLDQIEQCATFIKSQGLSVMRAGCYKPRTSPYSFQGMEKEGLALLDQMRAKYGLKIITEIKDGSHADEVIAVADIVQVGAKAMYDQSILRKCGKANKPVLIKRGFGTTIQEFLQAAEFVLSGGNEEVILCERGIRTFESKTRFTLDLCGVAHLKEYSNLPIILDPSHALGHRYGISDLARACLAMDIEGLLIESHPNPNEALSDAGQQLNFNQFMRLHEDLLPIAQAVNRPLV